MTRPRRLSRQAYRDMVTLARELLTRPTAHVTFFDDGSAEASYSDRTDEGFSARAVVVQPPESSARCYAFAVYDNARDCDGRHSYDQQGTAAPRKHRRRVYICRDHYRGTMGAFTIMPRFRFTFETSRQRDYTAEAAGY